MAVAAPLRAVPDLPPAPRPPFRLVRARCVRRSRLERLLTAAPGPLVVLVAPAGYGKTALLQQWDDADARPFVWLSAAAVDRDPVQLLDTVADSMGTPTVVVLDDAHLVRDRSALDVLRSVVERTAPGSLLVLASRGEAAVPLGSARAAGLVTELGPAELTMTAREAATFLRRTGLELTEGETQRIVRLAEGWPAGLRLAALSLSEQDDLRTAAARFAGDDRVVADYVRDELLSGLDDDAVAFLTRTSPLESLSGPLCDAVLGREGSGRLLRRLARADGLLIAIDRAEERFRTHPLLADMLRAELRRDEPGRMLDIHRRAGAWHEERGELEAAIEHATAAHDAERAGTLLWRVAPAYAADGRAELLQPWLARFDDAEIATHPPLALTAALRAVAGGDRDAAQRWADAAERTAVELERPVAVGLALVRAAIARNGAVRMGQDAARALALADPDGPVRASACLLAGIAHRITGEREQARVALEEGARRSHEAASTVRALCLAQLALLALDDGDRERGMLLADQARDCVTNPDDPGCAAAFAAAALAAALGGRVADARRDVDAARRLLPRLAAPWAGAELRVVLARAELRLSDAAAARELLTEAARLARATPDAIALQLAIDDAWECADTFAAGAVAGPSSLTTAELRVLRFLPSHLSFREIATRLHVSANTVKSQAQAVYRKLDASSRSEAVARARDVGLVDG